MDSIERTDTQSIQFSCSVVSDSVTPWTAAHQACLSFTISQSLLKLMSIELVMPSKHLILCHPLLLLSSIPLLLLSFPAAGSFSNESALHIRWPKYWSFSFSISPSLEYSGLISFRIDWFAKVGSQEIPGVTCKSGLAVQNEAGQRLIEFCQANALVIANTLFQ